MFFFSCIKQYKEYGKKKFWYVNFKCSKFLWPVFADQNLWHTCLIWENREDGVERRGNIFRGKERIQIIQDFFIFYVLSISYK